MLITLLSPSTSKDGAAIRFLMLRLLDITYASVVE